MRNGHKEWEYGSIKATSDHRFLLRAPAVKRDVGLDCRIQDEIRTKYAASNCERPKGLPAHIAYKKVTLQSLAKEYDISEGMIYRVVHGLGSKEVPVRNLQSFKYKRVDQLHRGDRLMPLLRRYDDTRGKLWTSRKGYEWEHKFIARAVYGPPRYDEMPCHHKNLNPADPTNLEWLTTSEHRALHGRLRPPTYIEHPRGMLGKKQTEHQREVASRLTKRRWEKWREINHEVIRSRFIGYEDVYDMTVPKYHNYVANGVVVHNCGKTTLARILAVAFQCPHDNVPFGQCLECYKEFQSFDIVQIPAAKIGKTEIMESLEGCNWAPRYGKYRVYIIDECHRMSLASQSLCLHYLEDTVDSTVFILCTTDPNAILETLQSRCVAYKVQALGQEDVLKLVTRLLKKVKSDKPADRLAEQLYERGVTIPRLIASAVEKYVSGGSLDEATEVEAGTSIDITALTRAVIKGDWDGARKFLYEAQLSDAKQIRLGCMAYLRGMLLNESEVGVQRGDVVAEALLILSTVQETTDLVMASAVTSCLYRLCGLFAQFKH